MQESKETGAELTTREELDALYKSIKKPDNKEEVQAQNE